MDEKITISAKTLDEAITKALIELQTTSEHLHYEVIQKESSGFLGLIGSKPCIIRARVMSEEEERALKQAAADKAKTEKEAAQKAAAEKAAAERAAAEKAKAEKAKAEKAAAEKAAEKAAVLKASSKPASGKTQEKVSQKPVSEKSYSKPEKKDTVNKDSQQKEKPAVKIDEEAVKKAAKEFLEQVFGAMGMTVKIETVYDASERELQVMMEGDDMGILIGKRGQTLDSLQYLVSLIVNKGTEGYLRVKLDTENYRERRKETLETLAKNIAYKVKRTKRPVSLEPMNPYERRIIHAALQNDKYVTTRSEGEEPFRHVVIALKKEASGGDRKGRYDKNKGGRYDRSSGGYKGNNRRSHYSSTASSGASEETAAGDEE